MKYAGPLYLGMRAYYVSSSGERSNDGLALSRAWPLDYALEGADGRVVAGTVVWLRGGFYRGSFVALVSGEEGKKIQFRAFNGEMVVLDRAAAEGEEGLLSVRGSNLEFRDLEFWNSGTFKKYPSGAVFPGRPGGVSVYGAGNRFVGCYFRALGWGLRVEDSGQASTMEVYGCAFQACGFLRDLGQKGFGGGLEVLGFSKGELRVKNCVFRNNYGESVLMVEGALDRMLLEGNTVEVRKPEVRVATRTRSAGDDQKVARLDFDSPHGIEVGERIEVSGVGEGYDYVGEPLLVGETYFTYLVSGDLPIESTVEVGSSAVVKVESMMSGGRIVIAPPGGINRLVVRGNVVLRGREMPYELVRLGGVGKELVVEDNYLAYGGPALSVGEWESVEAGGNVLGAYSFGYPLVLAGMRSSWIWDHNVYLGGGTQGQVLLGRARNFEDWKVDTGLDAASLSTQRRVTGTTYFLRGWDYVDAYEKRRGVVSFVDWEDTPCDLDLIGLVSVGEIVELWDACPISLGGTYFYRGTWSGEPIHLTEISKPFKSFHVKVVTPTGIPTELGLVVEVASDRQVNLRWRDIAVSGTGYQVHRSLDGGTTFVQVADLGEDVLEYSDSPLLPGTEYTYKVTYTYIGGAGQVDSGNHLPATTFLSEGGIAPVGVQYLGAMSSGPTSVDLTWELDAVEAGVVFAERKTAITDWEEVALAQLGEVWGDRSVEADTVYQYRVRVKRGELYSEYSKEVSVRTTPDAPEVAVGLVATAISAEAVDLTWENGARTQGVEVYVSDDEAFWSLVVVLEEGGSYRVRNLASSTEFYFRLRAFNEGGFSTYSDVVSATTSMAPPLGPTGLRAFVGVGQIQLLWTDNSNTEVVTKIQFKLIPEMEEWEEWGEVPEDQRYFDVLDPLPGATYSFRVYAVNAGGNSAFSNEVTVVVETLVPATPVGLKVNAVDPQAINLSWLDSSKNEESFSVERALARNGPWAEIGSVVFMEGIGGRGYLVSGLTGGIWYFFRVRAVNSHGSSGYSNVARGKTLPELPGEPQGVEVEVVSSSSARVSWVGVEFNAHAPETLTFEVDRQLSGGPWVELIKVPVGDQTYLDYGLDEESSYRYRVKAFNVGGSSDWVETGWIHTPAQVGVPEGFVSSEVVAYDKVRRPLLVGSSVSLISKRGVSMGIVVRLLEASKVRVKYKKLKENTKEQDLSGSIEETFVSNELLKIADDRVEAADRLLVEPAEAMVRRADSKRYPVVGRRRMR